MYKTTVSHTVFQSLCSLNNMQRLNIVWGALHDFASISAINYILIQSLFLFASSHVKPIAFDLPICFAWDISMRYVAATKRKNLLVGDT